MKRRDFLGLSGAFMVGETVQASPRLMAGNERIGGGLSGLTPTRPMPKDRFLLVYFGTAHRGPNCSADLAAVADAAARINRGCGQSIVSPVFVYPAPDARGQENVAAYVRGDMIGLSGPQTEVLRPARGYSARYAPDLNAHTRFVYLMNPQGRNIGIAGADLLPLIPAAEISAAMKRQNPDIPACTY